MGKISKASELTAINVSTSLGNQRKSTDFHNLLERLKESYDGSGVAVEEAEGEGVIRLDS